MAVECMCLTMNNDPNLEHMDHCPVQRNKEVLVFRNADNQPIPVPGELVESNDRTYRCYLSRLKGLSWEEIAAQENYASARQAMYEVQRYLDEAAELVAETTKKNMLLLEVSRLDALQAALWPEALKGHVASVGMAMNLILNRAKLLQLDLYVEPTEVPGVSRTVIIPSDSDGYMSALEQVANDG